MAALTVNERIQHLKTRHHYHTAFSVLEHSLDSPLVGKVAMVSSFGAESVVLLHMLSLINPDTPVLFIDTQMLFKETLTYQHKVAAKLGLTDIRIIHPDLKELKKRDPFNRLHLEDKETCCHLRKLEPLANALDGFDAWITGRKQFQTGTRSALNLFESEEGQRIKINPLVYWGREDLQNYIARNNLPRHPLVAKGYASIGCSPKACTSKVAEGEDPRSGRWRGSDKIECGIHFLDATISTAKQET